MKKIVLAATIFAASCAPSVAHAITVERVKEYVEVCRYVNKKELRGKALTDYLKSQWPTLEEAMENAGVCLAHAMGLLEGAQAMRAEIEGAK